LLQPSIHPLSSRPDGGPGSSGTPGHPRTPEEGILDPIASSGLLLVTASLLTGAVSAVLGMAGGILLLAVMLLFLEPTVAIPIHALVQLTANSSRAVIHARAIRLDLLWPYGLLLVPAGFLTLPLAERAPAEALRLAIGVFVLVATWRSRWLLLGLDPDPGVVLSRVHENLRSIMDPGRFLTLVLTVIDVPAGTLSYASAGHCEGVLHKGGETITLPHTGPPLGVDVDYTHKSVKIEGLKPGDGMLLFTDGLVEARNEDGELFGEERLAQLAVENSGTAAKQVDALLKAVAKFNHGSRNDDRTVVVTLWK